MLAQSNTIRDVSLALPALVSGPDLDAPDSVELLDRHAAALRERHDNLVPVIDCAGNALSEAMKAHNPEEVADPEGEGARALEQAEGYFKHRRDELGRLRETFIALRAPPSHDVFRALDRLDNLYMGIVATMQEVRWSVLIFDGVRDRANAPEGRALSSSAEWFASLDDE